jgi:hypothetical protein
MKATQQTAASDVWANLEVPTSDLTYMAGIALDLAWDLLDGETKKDPDSDVIIRLSIRQHEQLLFAIMKIHDMAMAIETIHEAQ